MSYFERVLDEYGEDAVVYTSGIEYPVKVFINPVIGERYMKKWRSMTKLGEVDESTFYYFGPPDCEIEDCDNSYVVCNGKHYKFIRAELYRIEGKPSHWEAVLRKKEEDFDGRA